MKPIALDIIEIVPSELPPIVGPRPIDVGERFKHIEIEVNTSCDCFCFGCDRLSDVTTAPNMTVDQVALFVQESLDLKWEWERIRILGGEPTLHPQFEQIIDLMTTYRDEYPNVFLQVLTNGHGKAAKYCEWLERQYISLHAEAKEVGVNPPWFTNTRIVPVDRWPDIGEVPPCGIFDVRGCGLGLSTWGYFLDGAGASLARVTGKDIGVQTLAQVTWESMISQANILCRICGHWAPNSLERNPLVTETGEVTGAFLAEALARYRQFPPKMTRYGGPI